ncbi:GerMN domain-containing protein [Caldifermentibacillus hisashii]|uniref:GerMN domain-containing protein n=1 Tax=Caldifermentibacillus hisashii TaxID=996558 RepID=UPI0034D7A4C9
MCLERSERNGYKNENAVYSDDLKEDSFLVTIGIPDEQALNVIPVSIIAKKESGKNWVDQINDVFGQINEEKLGLFDYLPYQGNFTNKEENSLNLNLEDNHQYNADSTSEMNFFTSLSYLKYQGINKVSFSVADTPGVHFAHHGEKIYELPLNENLQCGFLYYEKKGHVFLTPTPSRFSSIEEALINMQEGNERYHLKPTIPATLAYSVSVENHDQLIFKFTNKIKLEDNESDIRMIESILLTAKEFGFNKVQFQNTENAKIGSFDLRKAIDVPVAPNLIDLHAVTP